MLTIYSTTTLQYKSKIINENRIKRGAINDEQNEEESK